MKVLICQSFSLFFHLLVTAFGHQIRTFILLIAFYLSSHIIYFLRVLSLPRDK